MKDSQITWLDYLAMIFLLVISVLIGIYHGFRDRIHKFVYRNKTDIELPKDNAETETISKQQSLESDLYRSQTTTSIIKLDEKKNKTQDYLTANSSMGTIPVAFSILATIYSATTLLGLPAEIYQFGLKHWFVAFGQLSCPLIAAYVVCPYFAHLKIVSIFEYFELRFQSRNVRLIGTYCYIVKNSITSI